MSVKPTCSVLSAELAESLVGSAPQAIAWVALEQLGPWGAKAFTSSHLDPDVGAAIEAAANAVGVRPCLIRQPGRHADDHHERGHRLLVAFTEPGRSWLLSGLVATPSLVLDLDWGAVAAGDLEAVRRSLPALSAQDEPQLLVCTNGTRDLCCAAFGRPVAITAAQAHPGQVWEVTHTGGHRFAPTAVTLPSGVMHGRLSGGSAIRVLEAAGEGGLVLDGYRGRTTWAPAGQVAEHAVRQQIGELSLDALMVETDDEACLVRHLDGRAWRVTVASTTREEQRPESCAKGPVPLREWAVKSLAPHPSRPV